MAKSIRDWDKEVMFNEYMKELIKNKHSMTVKDIVDEFVLNYWNYLPKWILERIEIRG